MKLRVAAIAIVALGLAAAPSSAQDMLSYGVKIGVNFADVSRGGDEDEGVEDFQKKKVGVALGGFVEVPVAPMFSVQPEFLYTQKGTKLEAEQFNFEATTSVDMIQIPVLGKVKFQGGAVRPFVVFGPGFGFVTRAKEKSDDNGDEEEIDIKDQVQSVDVSLIVGGGVQFGKASVEVRYDHGVRNMVKDGDEGEEAKTRTFSVLFGYSWP